MSPAVSIVIPTYNRARTIRAAVESVLRQTFRDFELIVVDDCSTDDTRAILETIADPRLRVVHHEVNGGAAIARNTGAAAATGAWVAFQDSDDEWLPEKLERQMARLRDGDYVAGFCGMVIFGALNPEEGARPSVRYIPDETVARPDGDILEALLRGSFISTQTLIARRDLLVEEGFFDPTVPPVEDWDLAIRLARRGRFAFVDEPLVIQRFSPDSITRNRRNSVRGWTRIVEKNADLLARRRAVLAEHHHGIAGSWRNLGDYAAARRHLFRALGLAPFKLRSWASLACTAALALSGRGSRPGAAAARPVENRG